ncbi:unnamed protein product, partial [Hymenolepis diminuta]
MNVWVYKPNVIHRLIFGSRIKYLSEGLIKRIIYPKLHTGVEPFEETIIITKSSSVHYSFSSEFYAYTVTKSELFSIAPGVKTSSKFIDEVWLESVLVVKLNSWLNQEMNNSP